MFEEWKLKQFLLWIILTQRFKTCVSWIDVTWRNILLSLYSAKKRNVIPHLKCICHMKSQIFSFPSSPDEKICQYLTKLRAAVPAICYCISNTRLNVNSHLSSKFIFFNYWEYFFGPMTTKSEKMKNMPKGPCISRTHENKE